MIIVISNPAPVQHEQALINQLFDEGLDAFHVYKPSFSSGETEYFVQQIHPKYRARVVAHSGFLKFHSVEELEANGKNFVYAFLSPVFDSISKPGYKSNFDLPALSPALHAMKNKGQKIIALGGIDVNKIETVRKAGFSGVGLLGSIWQSENPVATFKQIQSLWLKKEPVH
jgi:thiamine-phosphate pyrophosphorylase